MQTCEVMYILYNMETTSYYCAVSFVAGKKGTIIFSLKIICLIVIHISYKLQGHTRKNVKKHRG